jgi:dihydrofolate reductase
MEETGTSGAGGAGGPSNRAGKVMCSITISVDGFVAGPRQSRENPLGERGELLHRWMFEQPELNPDEIASQTSAAAYVMGRNMFSSDRGEWDESWRGWWGEEPPYHAPVFVLTHHPRGPLTMQGGTTFNFVTDGIESALTQARAAANGQTILIAGGAATVNQYLAAGLIDDLWLHIAPITLGSGEPLFGGADVRLEPVDCRQTDLVTHVRYRILK